MLPFIIVTAVLAVIIAIFGINFSLVLHNADCRGIEHKEVLSKFFIPVYGIECVKKMGEVKNTYLAEKVLTVKGYVTTIVKWILLVTVLFFALNIAVNFKLNFLWKVCGWFVIIIFFFVSSSVCSSIAYKKGMNRLVAGFFGFVPFASVFYYCITNGKKRILPETVYQVYSFKDILGRVVIYGELVVLSFVVLIPIVYLLGSSLSPTESIPNEIWPSHPTWRNFQILFKQEKTTIKGVGTSAVETTTPVYYWYWFRNTLIVAILTMVISVFVITITAYVFSRFKFKGQKAGLLSMLILQMFPTFISMVAYYNLLKMLGLLNNPYALIAIYTSGAIPYNVWLIKGFLQNIPKDLDESATIDGANRLQIFVRIIFPLILPIITFVAVSQFMAPWLDYILPSYILTAKNIPETKNYTLAVGLFKFINSVADELYQPTLFCAGSLIIAIPISVLYVVFQRYLIEGITAGATKG